MSAGDAEVPIFGSSGSSSWVEVLGVPRVFSGESGEWSAEHQKVLDVCSEEAAQSDKGSNGLDVVQLRTVSNGPELVYSGLDAFRGECEPQVADLFIAEHWFVDVDFDIIVGQPAEDFVQGIEMGVMGVAVVQQIVNIDNAVLDT